MSSNLSPFAWLRAAYTAFFKHELVVARDPEGVRVVLADRSKPLPPRVPSKAQLAEKKAQADLELARADLAALLDEDPSLRSTVRHLAFVEHALAKKGWRGLYKVPLDVLQRAHQQLETMVTNWTPAGLACLRSKMAVAVLDREHQDEDVEADAYKTAAVLESPPVLAAQAIENAKASAEDESAALLATYAAMGLEVYEDSTIEVQGELGSPSAKALARSGARAEPTAADVRLRDLPA